MNGVRKDHTLAEWNIYIDSVHGIDAIVPTCHSLFYATSGVAFDFQILAYDQGQPSRSATATLRVNIRDVNNKSPLFLPSTVRRDVAESKWT